MKAERARLARLKRLERIRGITRQTALAEAGRAEGTLAQLQALGARTTDLAAEYAARRTTGDAAGLQQLHQFVSGLGRIVNSTAQDTARAREVADARAAEAALAEQRRAAVEERMTAQAQKIARKIAGGSDAAAPRGNKMGAGKLGTGLE
jgi:hypothetical protein